MFTHLGVWGVFFMCSLGVSGVGKGPCQLGWKLSTQSTLPREARVNQYLGNHAGGRGGDMEVRNGQEKEGD